MSSKSGPDRSLPVFTFPLPLITAIVALVTIELTFWQKSHSLLAMGLTALLTYHEEGLCLLFLIPIIASALSV